MDLEGKKVLVLGLGKSGLASVRFLKKKNAEVWVSEIEDNLFLKNLACQLEKEGIRVEIGRHSQEFMQGKDLIVISPGVSSNLPFLEKVKKEGIPIISEIELGYIFSPSPVIAITGTNGKTTVTTLIGKVLEKAGIPNIVCGNIGNPFTGALDSRINSYMYVVLEVSSFQLENIVSFKPYIAVVLNITPDHLDRYASFEEYIKAKERIFINQDNSDYLILNYRDPVTRGFAKKAKSKVLFFNCKKGNFTENQEVVLKVGSILGIPEETIFSVFREFRGLPHRCEFVAEIRKIIFINDSKATNIHSTRYSLNSFKQKVILIAGGRDKGQDFSCISRWIREKVKHLVLIGEGKEKIEKAVKDLVPIRKFDSLEEAVNYTYYIAKEGDIVILSPMCASFDMFKNYEDRGEIFKKLVLNLKDKAVCVK